MPETQEPASLENHRLNALHDLDLLDTSESESFDRITRMASQLFQAPISAVSLTDRSRQWFKSHVGTPGREIPREGTPCAEVTRSGEVLTVPDLLEDSRFAVSLLAESGVRFYAGAPLVTREGHVLGSMCVLDYKPRSISTEEVKPLQDLAAMVMAQIELQHDLGRIDSISGLPNRNQLTEDLEDLERSNPGEPRVAVLVDLADPRRINEMTGVLGTVYLDDLVKASSRVIRETLGRKTGLYQLGLTSFVILLDERQGQLWGDVVDALMKQFKTPIVCNGIPVFTNAAFGISPFFLCKSSPGDVLRTAVSAAHDAREAEIDYAIYSPASDEANRRRFTLLTDVREALKQPDQFSLVYQPRMDVLTGACNGAEALLRWQNPKLGSVSPGEFIPLVEQTALAGPITQWVLAMALRQVAVWRGTGLDIRVSINISARNLEEDNFAQSVEKLLAKYAVPPDSIELEFTESALIRNRSRVIRQLEAVRSMGVALAIDDFGTGYSTFSYLHKLPASIVKLDQSFMPELARNPRDRALVKSIISMAHDIGYRVVAEGVETTEVYQFLVECGCDEIQGYLISRPLPVKAFETFMRRSGAPSLAVTPPRTEISDNGLLAHSAA